ncbi:sugar phosphate isomerase/epimerase [Acidobacteria bacterium AB60]|nr:sugar phosphate isomerase/epimerase [Acidobacteria bacterium AB60]
MRGNGTILMDKLSRRSFLRSSAAAAAAAAALPATGLATPSQETGKPSPIKLGICSYTFRNFSREQMIGFLKQLHMDELNAKDIKDHLPADPAGEDAALAAYKTAGIKLHAAGTIYFRKNEDEDVRKQFEYCKRAGIGVIVAGDPTPETLPRIEKFAKEYDIKIAIHNHGPEDKVWPSPLDVLKSLKGMDPRMGCCVDVGHTVRAGTDVVEAIRQIGPRLFDVHMKDLTDFTAKESQVNVGDGKMPVREIFEELIRIRYGGFVDLEYEVHGDDPMPGVIASIAYMRGVLTGLGYLTAPQE